MKRNEARGIRASILKSQSKMLLFILQSHTTVRQTYTGVTIFIFGEL